MANDNINNNRVDEILNQFSKVKILCIGDIALDSFIHGNATRVSPEAPVPVVLVETEQQMLGCAGNVVANLKDLSCEVHLIGVVGNDDNAKKIRNLLKTIGDNGNGLVKSSSRPTTKKTRIIAIKQQVLRLDIEMTDPLNKTEQNALLRKVKKHIDNVDCVILSDYAKGVLTEGKNGTTQQIIQMAKNANKPVFIDPKGSNYAKYKGAYLVKPNRQELEAVTKQPISQKATDFIQTVSVLARKVATDNGIENIIVTLSENGMLYVPCDPTQESIHLPTVATSVFDVSGAGDTSMAALAAALCCKATMKEAMMIANSAAGIVVQKVGTATTNIQEIKEMLLSRTHT